MLRFLFIAAVVVLGVGIYKHAITWPDCQRIWSNDWTKWRIWNIIQYGYSQLYDEQLDFLDSKRNLYISLQRQSSKLSFINCGEVHI